MFLEKSRFESAFEALQLGARLFVPLRNEGTVRFEPWTRGAVCDFSARSDLPPKDAFFPRTEELYSFENRGGSLSISESPDPLPAVLFGIRPCDVASIERMDAVFLTGAFTDKSYAQRRENTLIAALVCSKSWRSCFCESMGIDPNSARGADLEMRETPEGLFIEPLTKKGGGLLEQLKPYLTERVCGDSAAASCTLKCEASGLAEKLPQMYENEIWTRAAEKCLGCGVCTYVCPTCYCFDINHEESGSCGTAFRCWDSCMFSEYTRMAGGENPRPTRRERVRNRFLHKLLYFEERYGKPLCVGCGRCLEKCPAGVDIAEIIEIAGRGV